MRDKTQVYRGGGGGGREQLREKGLIPRIREHEEFYCFLAIKTSSVKFNCLIIVFYK